MTERKDDPETEALRDSERAEYDWLMARDADPSAPAPSQAVADDYARLESLLATLPDDPDAAWQAGLLDKIRTAGDVTPIRASRKRAVRWVALGGVVAAAIAVLLVFDPRSSQNSTEREALMSPRNGIAVRGDHTTYTVGDTLATVDAPLSTEWRLYAPDGALVARCPGAGCIRSGESQRLEYVARMRGRYLVIRTEQQHPELTVAKDDYLDALTKAGIAYRQAEPKVD